MPYRRLPNTDNARIKAMRAALEKGKKHTPMELAYSQANFQKLRYFLPQFEQAIALHKSSYDEQVTRNKEYAEHYRKAKLYISHFIQVLNFAILRGEQKDQIREYYGLKDKKVPPLSSEADILKWGKKIIDGEQARISKGGSYMTNPTIGVVRVRYEQFKEAARRQKSLQETTQRQQDKVASMRNDADEIIQNIWNEVEASFDKLPDRDRREKCENYGLVYVFRKNEVRELI